MKRLTLLYLVNLMLFLVLGCKKEISNKITIVNEENQELIESDASQSKSPTIDPSSLNVREGIKTIKESWYEASTEDKGKFKIIGKADSPIPMIHYNFLPYINNVSPSSISFFDETLTSFSESGKIERMDILKNGDSRVKLVFNYVGENFKIFREDDYDNLTLLSTAIIDAASGLPTYKNGSSINPEKSHLYGNEVIKYENYGNYVLATATSQAEKILYKEKFSIDNKKIVSKTKQDFNVNTSTYEEEFPDNELFRTTTASYEYNKNGDVKKVVYVIDGETLKFDINYEYNSKGDWTKCTVIAESSAEPMAYIGIREYEYY